MFLFSNQKEKKRKSNETCLFSNIDDFKMMKKNLWQHAKENLIVCVLVSLILYSKKESESTEN